MDLIDVQINIVYYTIMEEDKELEELYFELTSHAAEKITNGSDVLEVSALLIRIGLELYRTTMSDEDYDKMVDFISKNRHQITPITPGEQHVH